MLQENELSEKEKLINKKNRELIEAKEEVQRLMLQSRWIEGNSYYTQGEAIEEMAKRTKLAAQKRRKTYKKALIMYQKALSLGVEKATKKIKRLQHKYKRAK